MGMKNPDLQYLFVYGTLRGMRQGLRLGKGFIRGFKMFHLGFFPGVNHGNGKVVGDLYLVDKHTLRQLDKLEGHPNWYRREEVKVLEQDGSESKAWFYRYPDEGDAVKSIPSGNWFDAPRAIIEKDEEA